MNWLPLSLLSFPSSLWLNQRDVRCYQHLQFFFLEVIQKNIGDFESSEKKKRKQEVNKSSCEP